MRRSAPAALRNREPIAAVLRDWLPSHGTVLEIASGTGEHAVHFASSFPQLTWQPSDPDKVGLESIRAWQRSSGLANLRSPLRLDAAGPWPPIKPLAILCINMAHISPWAATESLLGRAAERLADDGLLIFYGPWIENGVETAASNVAFDADLRRRDPAWGLRRVEALAAAAEMHGLKLVERRAMPANNLMLRLGR